MDNAGERPDKSLSLSNLNRIDQVSDRFEQAIQEALQSGGPWPEIEDYLGDTPEALRSELRKELAKVQDSCRQQSGSPIEDADARPAKAASSGPGPQSGTVECRAAVPPPVATDTVGDVIAGRYKLIEEIGEGGMGTVFMAQQAVPVKRVVAVKIVKPGMDSKAVLARFEAERQALALMDHPNIARVLDAGSTESGRPFFVMELVKGIPITQYCDQHKLTPRAAPGTLRAGLPGDPARPPEGRHPSRHQAVQRAGGALRRQARAQGDRLRPGQGGRASADREDADDRVRGSCRHAGVHVARSRPT